LPDATQGQPLTPSPVFAGTYHLKGDPRGAAYPYGRDNNPTWSAYENAICELENADSTIVFSSGMAAVFATLGVTLKPGDALVMPSDGYFGVRLLARDFFTSLGVNVRLAPTANNAQLEHLEGAKLLWIESPSNPGLSVCDIATLAEAAHAAGALVVVDNATATCIGQQPLALGADICVSSDTKATTGHSDLLLGHVSVLDRVLAELLREWRMQMGSGPGPFEVWLAHRSLATLDVRLERQCRNALAIAEFMSTRPDVRVLRYPGLKTDPSYPIASRQMTYYGPIVSFELAGRQQAEQFLASCELVFEATSFGGVHTTAERRARWGKDDITEGFIRLSVGCEDSQDLIADLTQALERINR
jgi:cystathionine gamma-lyase